MPRSLANSPEVRAARRELRTAERRYRRAAERAEELRRARNAAVGSAVDLGLSHVEIAEATGLHRSRIGQLRAEA